MEYSGDFWNIVDLPKSVLSAYDFVDPLFEEEVLSIYNKSVSCLSVVITSLQRTTPPSLKVGHLLAPEPLTGLKNMFG